jgi:hypothetical protein
MLPHIVLQAVRGTTVIPVSQSYAFTVSLLLTAGNLIVWLKMVCTKTFKSEKYNEVTSQL